MLRIFTLDLAFHARLFQPLVAAISHRRVCLLVALVVFISFAEQSQAQACEPEMARLTSVQGTVEIRPSEAGAWRPAELNDILCIGATIRVSTLSRAALAFTDDSTLRLDQDTTLTIREREEERRTWLEMLTGAIHFFSHRPRSLKVDTPFVNAAAEGTEFLIRISGAEAHILMYEGVVLASNEAGQLRLGPDDAALIRAGEKPIPEIVVRPRDAVAWAVHYPPVLSILADIGEPGVYPHEVKTALEWLGDNNYRYALRSLDKVPENQRDARNEALRAGILLNIGRVDEAEAAIERALAIDADAADALALRTILHVTRNDRAQALRDADRAVTLAPNSSTALIAQSYARQASFDLEGARESLRTAVEENPNDALAHARLSEIELSFGDIDRASDAATEATRLAPNLARTQTVRGFSHLAEIDTDAAREAFTKSITFDSADPLPHLGQGLAKIRDGNLEAGRRDLEIAASLDPNNALIRSYLGKAYFEEKRGPKDATQFDIAKKLDPNDPTPWFYDAIRKQTENRPVEALRDLEKAIELNDNRAVNRSRLLLDEDLAARGVRLGRIYNDLGFEQLALVEGTRSTDQNPTDYSAHRLLADSYAVLPRHQIARDSELLQSQLLQPININPVQPSLAGDRLSALSSAGPSDVGLAEFGQLFASNRARAHLDGVVGTSNTLADNLIVSGVHDSISYSLGQSHFETDGFHSNNDENQDIYNAFVQIALSPITGIQGEIRRIDEKSGDPALRFTTDEFAEDERRDGSRNIVRLGLRHDFSPNSTTLLSYIFRDDEDELDQGSEGLRIEAEEDAHFGELRHLQRWTRLALTFGFGHFDGESDNVIAFGPFPSFREVADLRHTNSYVYSNIGFGDLTLTLGVSGDNFEGIGVDRSQANPKFGLVWDATHQTTLRAAVFRTLKRTLISDQTIEPSHVAGFNQFFDDVNGSDVWRYGFAVDHKVSSGVFFGAEYSERNIDVPSLTTEEPVQSTIVDEDEQLARLYLYWSPSDRWAFGAEYRYEQFDFDPLGTEPRRFTKANSHKIPLELQYFHPDGLFSGIRVIYVNQDTRFFDLDGNLQDGSDSFFTFDASLGYRLPNRSGILSIEAENLFDKNFDFFESDRDDSTLARERLIMGRFTLQF